MNRRDRVIRFPLGDLGVPGAARTVGAAVRRIRAQARVATAEWPIDP